MTLNYLVTNHSSPSFQWTSALPIDAYTNAACTISYTVGTPATIVYVKPTLAQLEQTIYSLTAKANLANVQQVL
jgi:hypothetical protein